MTLLERILKLTEKALTANEIFSDWIKPEEVEALNEKFADLRKTQKGQKEILERASNGDEDAVLYLYYEYLPLTTKAFWKYYIGENKEFGVQKLYSGAASTLLIDAIELLSGRSETNPFRTFDAAVFSKDTDLIKQFSYYYYRYFQNECAKEWRKEKRKGLVGNLKSDEDFSVESYENYLDNSEETAVSSSEDTSDLKIIMQDFKDWLKENNRDLEAQVFDLKLKEYNNEDIAEKLNIELKDVKRIWFHIQKDFQAKYPDLR